jgi:hypothetical protein
MKPQSSPWSCCCSQRSASCSVVNSYTTKDTDMSETEAKPQPQQPEQPAPQPNQPPQQPAQPQPEPDSAG